MKILFIQDFQGVETGGRFYQRGQIVDLEYSVAARLVADKRAEVIEEKVIPAQVDGVVIPQELPRRRGRK